MRGKGWIIMKVWTVKFKSYNREDYYETVSGKDEKEALENAKRLTVKKDDRDEIEWITEDNTNGLGGYPW
ncbi:hypothetical protein HMSSN139_66110 [Paenibacillus sp. HMSSN-139]|nr:hypothetical protein HMSSN139_66110 [Paenibacillus sp. HMSSN-139]